MTTRRKLGNSLETNKLSPDELALVEGAKPGGILLAHDIHPGTIEAMPVTIRDLKAKGFGFATVSQLLALQDTPTPRPAPAVQEQAAARQS